MAIMGTTAILIVQALAAFASVSYFHVHKKHPETANWFRTFLAPLAGGIGMLYVIWLLVENASFAAGAAATDIVFKLSPWIVGLAGLGGVAFALYAKYFSPERYQVIGRVALEDTQEREAAEPDADEVPSRCRGRGHGGPAGLPRPHPRARVLGGRTRERLAHAERVPSRCSVRDDDDDRHTMEKSMTLTASTARGQGTAGSRPGHPLEPLTPEELSAAAALLRGQEQFPEGTRFVYLELAERSEERRVGKECRSRWSPYH